MVVAAGVNPEQNKWLPIFYVPETAVVKEKTVYASSISALKEGLGQASFVNDYHISTQVMG